MNSSEANMVLAATDARARPSRNTYITIKTVSYTSLTYFTYYIIYKDFSRKRMQKLRDGKKDV